MIQFLKGKVKAYNSRASAYRASALSIPNVTYTEIVMDTEDYDERGEFSVATGRFTADQAGFYLITFSAGLLALSAGRRIIVQLRKNGAEPALVERQTRIAATDWVACGVPKDIHLAAGDYVSVFVYHNDGDIRSIMAAANVTWLTARRFA